MNAFAKLAMALAISAFAFSAPVMAADIPTPQAPSAPDLTGAVKDKAADIVDQAKDKAVEKAKDALGVKKPANPGEVVDVQQESVTVQTPQGTASETTTTIIPEKAPAVK